MERFPLYKKYKLIEKGEDEINGAWKGAHLLLFFLAFVFGSFCTFCFHMLMYMFDEKCVLFPKILSLSSIDHDVIYDFLPEGTDKSDSLPVDFLSTQWMEKSACFLPTYVPLLSGIFGLVWTTMFLMCSSGSRTLTGLQRPYRVLFPIFLFSLAMGILCVYSSVVTHSGLYELCYKLNEATGSKDTSCTYTVNVATLVYERRIRGVYQATRLTIISAWLHTSCWLLSAGLTVVRVLLAVDFYLVQISVDLVGNIDRMVERHEEQLRTVSANIWFKSSHTGSEASTKVHFRNKTFASLYSDKVTDKDNKNIKTNGTLYITKLRPYTSELSLVTEERNRLARLNAYNRFTKEYRFIVKMIYDLIDIIKLPELEESSSIIQSESISDTESNLRIKSYAAVRQLGQSMITSKEDNIRKYRQQISLNEDEAEVIALGIKTKLGHNFNKTLKSMEVEESNIGITFQSSQQTETTQDENANKEESEDVEKEPKTSGSSSSKQNERKVVRKPNLKHKGIQTDKRRKKRKPGAQKVHIAESRTSYFLEPSVITITEVDKEVQTAISKEKQD